MAAASFLTFYEMWPDCTLALGEQIPIPSLGDCPPCTLNIVKNFLDKPRLAKLLIIAYYSWQRGLLLFRYGQTDRSLGVTYGSFHRFPVTRRRAVG